MVYDSRVIRAYVLHGRTGKDVLDYSAFFDWLASLPRPATRVEVGQDHVLAIDRMVAGKEDWSFRFISGNPGEIPLMYDESAGTTVEEPTREGQWRAVPTRVTVQPEARVLILEGRRAGVGATSLERYFSRCAAENGYAPRLTLEMNPLPSSSFESELDDFERIREASIIARRPNNDWDDANDVLSDLADSSDAHRASLTANAARGESLSRSRGIMALIRSHVRRPLINVEDVAVKGTPPGSKQEKTVRLSKHQLQERVSVQRGQTLTQEDDEMFEAQRSFLRRASEAVRDLADLRPDEEV